jgi:hypothetical protein
MKEQEDIKQEEQAHGRPSTDEKSPAEEGQRDPLASGSPQDHNEWVYRDPQGVVQVLGHAECSIQCLDGRVSTAIEHLAFHP